MKGSNGKGFQSIWSQAKVKRSVAVLAGAILTAGGVFFAGHQYVGANKVPFYRVYMEGQEIGTVRKQEDLTAFYKQKQQSLEQQYPEANIEIDTDGITAVLDQAYKADEQMELGDAIAVLDKRLVPTSAGIEIKVNGHVVGLVKDQATANQVLQQVKSKYLPQTAVPAMKLQRTAYIPNTKSDDSAPEGIVESSAIMEKVVRNSVETTPSKIMTAEAVVQRLTEKKQISTTYEVQDGDTVGSIAKRTGTSEHVLFTMNPGIQETRLKIGSELKLSVPDSLVTVKTVERISTEAASEPFVEVRKTNELNQGTSKVVAAGVNGRKLMTFRVVKENGQVVGRQFISQQVTQAAQPKVVLQGTKVIAKVKAASISSGLFAWPVSGHSITSKFGVRWNKLHKGLDIISSNRSILAADSGRVTFAGTRNGYGNCIVISHGNGYETLYGHLSKISVRQGERVDQGDRIGTMGDTGHSFGIHLHFEIHKNGTLQNPVKYLN
ncbi:murein DD-endopeptidase MepM/ murein hydrolase activator NlpD [Paenibacillus shirakamiensis]|uniref:Murein DD-endopeptidase MepM/ murein hydrolase activator NlpD n=1 Tax=Paenibacillus shirakamiensis TaxID=1265935 RepID=A0ABS4JKV5_9BACL|nr:peptidoglycan DD-metalloendopeptidase family protein [Paenibacillus shirakamiensis]MBP2002323.1 murein DD-endopeptidase MepM/ murein hydrolase activator NlpD [Paenibacillus shirakamiensis]